MTNQKKNEKKKHPITYLHEGLSKHGSEYIYRYWLLVGWDWQWLQAGEHSTITNLITFLLKLINFETEEGKKIPVFHFKILVLPCMYIYVMANYLYYGSILLLNLLLLFFYLLSDYCQTYYAYHIFIFCIVVAIIWNW